jgi:mono/diheme cytochrome c family protein
MRQALCALAAAFLLGACSSASQAPPRAAPLTTADVAEGQRLAEIHCSTCHAIGAEGASRHSMAPPFRTLSRDYPVTALEEAFAEGILVGHPDMPEFRLEPPQIDAIIAYIHSIQEQPAG